MRDHLLQTKLHRPPLRPSLVARPRLLEQLERGLQLGHKLTLVSAPPGFGKTTLISEWVQTPGTAPATRATAWLSLDENDNDLAHFLGYLIAALQTLGDQQDAAIRFGRGLPRQLRSNQPPVAETVLTPLINEIADQPHQIVFVLDDCHHIERQSIFEALAFLIQHIPPQMHLVLISRADPALSLGRLRALNQLTELRAADLRFNTQEAAEFLKRSMGLDLSAEDIAELETRTEGWIAGLQLAAISLQGRKHAARRIKSFSGSHRFVLDYLIEEVLEQQSEDTQRFLLQTAVLDRLNGDLCDALTGQDDGQSTLQEMELANLFIVPLDDDGRWYRYHHLFSELLRRRLRQVQPEWPPRLHRRASDWYAKNGHVDEAIEYALRAKDLERTADLLEQTAETVRRRGDYAKLRRWLEELPDALIVARPHLSILRAEGLLIAGQQVEAERILHEVELALESSADRRAATEPPGRSRLSANELRKLKGRTAATRSLLAFYRGDVSGIIHHSRQALAYLPDEDFSWRSSAANAVGDAHVIRGEMVAAQQVLLEALEANKAIGDVYMILIASLKLAVTLRQRGKLHETVTICQQQADFAEENGLSQTAVGGWLLAIWGEALAELDDLETALDLVKRGFQLTRHGQEVGDVAMIGWSYLCLGRTLFSSENLAGAEAAMQEATEFAQASDVPPWITDMIAAWRTRIWLVQGRLEAAARWAEQCGLDGRDRLLPSDQIGFSLLFEQIVLARLLLLQQRQQEAVDRLQHLLEAAEAGGQISSMIEINVLLSLAFQSSDKPGQALSALGRSLALAESQGFIRTFVDEGRPMIGLLNEIHHRGITPAYARRLLAAFPAGQRPPPATTGYQVDHTELIEPLSERELEVLQYVAQGLTNREIADRLILSPHTIKVHTRNIYGKLDVHNRTQAVARARTLKILDSL